MICRLVNDRPRQMSPRGSRTRGLPNSTAESKLPVYKYSRDLMSFHNIPPERPVHHLNEHFRNVSSGTGVETFPLLDIITSKTEPSTAQRSSVRTPKKQSNRLQAKASQGGRQIANPELRGLRSMFAQLVLRVQLLRITRRKCPESAPLANEGSAVADPQRFGSASLFQPPPECQS